MMFFDVMYPTLVGKCSKSRRHATVIARARNEAEARRQAHSILRVREPRARVDGPPLVRRVKKPKGKRLVAGVWANTEG